MSKSIKPNHVARFRALAKQLDALMREICAYCPDAELYIEDAGNANLMKGPTHTSTSEMRAIRENVVAHESIFRASGGGW